MTLSQRAVSAFFTSVGILHFVVPKQFEAIVPEYVPMNAKDAVLYSGIAEVAGGVMAVPESTRGLARLWLTGLLLAVFPANIHMAVSPESVKGLDLNKIPRWTLWARLPLQFVAVWWVWRSLED